MVQGEAPGTFPPRFCSGRLEAVGPARDRVKTINGVGKAPATIGTQCGEVGKAVIGQATFGEVARLREAFHVRFPVQALIPTCGHFDPIIYFPHSSCLRPRGCVISQLARSAGFELATF